MRPTLPLLAAAAPLLLLLIAASAPVADGYNITKILAQHPDFSTFNHYLTVTHLSSEINRRLTITILVVDNAGMADLLSMHYSLLTLRNVLALHILTDYYGSKKLHQLTHHSTRASSVFQSSGHAPGTTGYINITDHRAGKVTFHTEDTGGASPVTFVKSIKEMPYNISILQVSSIMSSPEAEAPVAAPAPVNLTELMGKKGCKAFADLLLAQPAVLKTFQDNLDAGLTVFCPIDSAIKAFAPRFKNLTAENKTSLILYHGVPIYYSPQLLKSSDGIIPTLATEATRRNFHYTSKADGTSIVIKTRLNTATITSTIIDQDPDAIYAINKVLEPKELFKPDPVDDSTADAPAGSKKGHGEADGPAADGPAAPADQEASDNSAYRADVAGRWLAATLAAALALV